jgi:zinc protease
LRLLGRRLGALRPPPPPRVTLAAPARAASGPRLQVVDKPERTQSQLIIGQPALRRAHPDYLALSVAASAFGGTFTSRLMREVRVKRGLSYGASAAVGQGRGTRAFTMAMAPSIDHTVETLALVLGLWRDFVERGLGDDEIEFAKEHLASAFAFQVATPEDRIDLRVALEVFELPADTLARIVPALRALTPADVHAAMARHLHPNALSITAVSTAKRLLPALRRARLLGDAAIDVVHYDAY